MPRPLFITLEGTEGVGKSTNLQHICDQLSARGVPFVRTREPGGTPFAEELRECLLRRREETVHPTAELLAIFSARAQHLNHVILPALARGEWVICDRFTDATYAYQGGGRRLDTSLIQMLETLVQGAFRPDAVIVLDVDPRIGLARAQARSEKDRFESEAVEFFERVRLAYRERALQAPERYYLVDAGCPLDEVRARLNEIIGHLCEDVARE